MNLSGFDNVTFHHAGVDHIPLDSGSMDFGISLGVLHHVPDTDAGIAECVRVIKPGGALLLYLYYRFDNRPRWFRALWKVTDVGRMVISRLPFAVRKAVTAVIATTVYWPVAHLLALAERAGRRVDGLPLSAYRDKRFYMMRTDALDRFGTRLELRFTRSEIEAMLRRAGMTEIRFSDKTPFWCVSAIKPHHPASSDRTSGSTDTDPVSNPGGRALRAVPARPARRNHRSR